MGGALTYLPKQMKHELADSSDSQARNVSYEKLNGIPNFLNLSSIKLCGFTAMLLFCFSYSSMTFTLRNGRILPGKYPSSFILSLYSHIQIF